MEPSEAQLSVDRGRAAVLRADGHVDVLQGDTPALADSLLKWVYIAPAPGLPIPDVVYRSGVETLMLQFHATAIGELTELAGLGPAGTIGVLQINQVGILGRGSGQGATADGYPVERVELRAIGQ
jgi:hypothetical protein